MKQKSKAYLFFKRAFDIFFSLFFILLLSPLLLLMLIIEAIITKGHPIYLDKRVGKNRKSFMIYKFRSMVLDAETNIDAYLTPEQKELWLKQRKIDDDPRVTKHGHFLRKTSLDELPQLFNILFGTMSFVGPRPITDIELANYSDSEQDILLSVRPGLTGYWAVYGRNTKNFSSGERQKLELEYFSHRGFFFDLYLLLATVKTVLSQKGAE